MPSYLHYHYHHYTKCHLPMRHAPRRLAVFTVSSYALTRGRESFTISDTLLKGQCVEVILAPAVQHTVQQLVQVLRVVKLTATTPVMCYSARHDLWTKLDIGEHNNYFVLKLLCSGKTMCTVVILKD